MKKINVLLGLSNNEFERQLKETINDIVDSLFKINNNQQIIINKLLKQHTTTHESTICDLCKNEASITVIDNNDNSYKFFCNKCLV